MLLSMSYLYFSLAFTAFSGVEEVDVGERDVGESGEEGEVSDSESDKIITGLEASLPVAMLATSLASPTARPFRKGR
jgi:hypothetical protein